MQATQRRITAFIKDSDEFEARREFNNWFVSSGVVLVIDMQNGTAEFGRGEVRIERRKKTLLSLSLLEEDAAALGATDQEIEQLGKQIAERNAVMAERRKEAKKAEEERRRNRVPHIPEDKAAIKAWVEQKQKDVAERDFKRWQAGELQSDWPQPHRAEWGCDLLLLEHIVKKQKADDKKAASQSRRPKSLRQQQMQQQQ